MFSKKYAIFFIPSEVTIMFCLIWDIVVFINWKNILNTLESVVDFCVIIVYYDYCIVFKNIKKSNIP